MDSMNTQNAYEQEIDLKDLLFAVLRKWKFVLASAVAFAVLLGGAKGFLTYRSFSDPEAIAEKEEAYKVELQRYHDDKEISEREIKNITDDIANRQEYMENSVLMNMSPYDVGEAKADLFIKTDYMIMPDMTYQNIDYTNTILQSYQSMITSAAFLEGITRSTGIRERYLQELIFVERGSSTVAGTNISELTNLLTIKVQHASVAEAEEILDDILKQVAVLQQQITQNIGEHTVNTLNQSSGSIVDLALASKQEDENKRMDTLKTTLIEKEKMLKEMKEPTMNSSSNMAALKSAVKYGILGGVLGAFMVVFFVCVFFLMSDRLYSSRELRNRFRVKVLGRLPLANGKKGNKIDTLLNRLEGKPSPGATATELEVIAANIQNYAGDKKSLLVSGTAMPDFITQVAEQLKGQLSDMQVFVGGNILQNAETIMKLPECDGVVLVEQCGFSTYQSIELEIEKIRDLDKDIIGTVVFE
ncbi:MAG: hypothetical protein HFJ41_07930 [Clostridia bacterium]|nr:hypothetical protein [Clostridia bacterium]MCI8866418.1 hypothetical protein [Lachnospiraceae bacterium]